MLRGIRARRRALIYLGYRPWYATLRAIVETWR